MNLMSPQRRQFLQQLCAVFAVSCSRTAIALMPNDNAPADAVFVNPQTAVSPLLSSSQGVIFRQWALCILQRQLSAGPALQWLQRDCAGLVRFVVGEALAEHSLHWQQSFGLQHHPLPAPLVLTPQQQSLRNHWHTLSGTDSAWVSALELIQANTRFISKNLLKAREIDLFFYDQGDSQHLMIWTGSRLAYHTGQVSHTDNGLRAYTLGQLMQWRDPRWRPQEDNPNFAGIYRLSFLS